LGFVAINVRNPYCSNYFVFYSTTTFLHRTPLHKFWFLETWVKLKVWA